MNRLDWEKAKEHAQYMIDTYSTEGMTKGEKFHEDRRLNLANAFMLLYNYVYTNPLTRVFPK